MDDMVRLGLFILCFIVVLARIPAVWSRQQRPLWLVLLMLGLGLTLLLKSVTQGIRHLVGIPYLESLASSLLAVGVATTLLMFALQTSRPNEYQSTPFSHLRYAWCTLTVMTMVITFSITVSQGTPHRDRFLPTPGTFTAHTVYWITYLLYMVGVTTWTAVLFWRCIPRIHSRLLRAAVLLFAIAESAFLGFLATRVVAMFSSSPKTLPLGMYVSSFHSVGITIGCSIAIILPLKRSVANWRHCATLYPLWKALCEALPHITLNPPRTKLVDTLTLRNSQLRLHRRLIEIRDGLLIMHDWITPEHLNQIHAAIPVASLTDDQREAATTACWLKVALRAKEIGCAPVEDPLDLVRRGGVDAMTELRWLREVADAWSSPLINDCAAAINLVQSESH
ncbi:MAB_1171c family putative transporter [Nocardia sp. NPDC051570]|uniref:MAB_1171c family putative transporter n=1 Tax=Nocardia sp. NPDC051570 TaxID=3364324 RepID=UPI0037A16D13